MRNITHWVEDFVHARVLVKQIRAVGHERETGIGSAGLEQKVVAWKSPSNDMRQRALLRKGRTDSRDTKKSCT